LRFAKKRPKKHAMARLLASPLPVKNGDQKWILRFKCQISVEFHSKSRSDFLRTLAVLPTAKKSKGSQSASSRGRAITVSIPAEQVSHQAVRFANRLAALWREWNPGTEAG
jgi:hypothetical protein